MSKLEEKTIFSENKFKGKLLDVRKDKVTLPNNRIGFREWINHPGAACSIPLLSEKARHIASGSAGLGTNGRES